MFIGTEVNFIGFNQKYKFDKKWVLKKMKEYKFMILMKLFDTWEQTMSMCVGKYFEYINVIKNKYKMRILFLFKERRDETFIWLLS
jgi:hypothetical protein